MKVTIGPSTDFPNPKPKKGWSVWIENAIYYTAKTVNNKKFGCHDYNRPDPYSSGTGSCRCGCYMGSCNSSGDVDPFGACPLNPIGVNT